MMSVDSTKKIVYITGQLGLGGAEKQLYLLTRALVRRGWHITVVTLNGGTGDFWEGPIQEAGVSLISLPAKGSKASRLVALTKILASIRPAIVHSWTIYANIYAALAGKFAGIRCKIGSERANHNSSRQDVGNFWYAQSLRGLDALVTNSLPAARYLQSYKPELKTCVVRNAVEIPLPVGNGDRASLRREVGVPELALVVGSIGGLVPRKGFARLIESVSSLEERWPSMHFVLIGDGPLRNELYRKAAQALSPERVHFVGARPYASRFCPVFDVFCFPSEDQEGMPNVLMEAAAFGVPAVASNVGSASEVIEHNVTGLLVEGNRVHDMSACIEKLLADANLRAAMGEAAREKVRNEFSVEAMVSNMEQVYLEVLCAS